MQRFPVDLTATFIGVKEASQFTSRQTGELVDVKPKVQFLTIAASGEANVLSLTSEAVDRAADADLNYSKLEAGESLRLIGEAVVQDRGSDRDSYFSLVRIERIDAPASAANGTRPTAKTA